MAVSKSGAPHSLAARCLLRLVRLTYFTQMGLAALIRLNMRTAQLAKRRLRPLPLPGVEGERRAVISRLLSLALN